MKRSIFFAISILSFILLSQIVSSEINDSLLTGNMVVDSVTGKLTSQQLGMNIFVQTTVPYVQIISPKNQTYLKNESILLNYTLINGDYVWYNLDNSENITISSSIQFNVSQGLHTLYIFSNNSNDTVASSTSFTANSSKFIIISENYEGSNKGASTNFLNYTYEEIQNLDNIILENTDYGKILFNEAINLTDNKNATDNLWDIDANIIISPNRIEINSTELPNFNKSATLLLYNLNFTNPRILKDGEVCPSDICIKESYTSNILKFNVTGFSIYSAEETPTNISEGGGGKGIEEEKFEIKPEEIKVSLKQGENISRKIIIKNTGDKILGVKLEISSLENLIKLNETEFYIHPKESKEIEANIQIGEEVSPEIYIGKIIATSKDTQKEILVAIEVESKVSLFDIKIKIPSRYKYVLPGGEVLAQIELYNVGSNEEVDVLLDYIIKDDKGDEIVKEHDTLAVENSIDFTKRIELPKDLPRGVYVFYVKLTYEDKTASASSWFNVEKIELDKLKMFLYILVIILIIIILILIYEIRKIKKYLKPIYNVDENLLVKKGLVKVKR